MRQLRVKLLLCVVIIFIWGSLLTSLIWYKFSNYDSGQHQKKEADQRTGTEGAERHEAPADIVESDRQPPPRKSVPVPSLQCKNHSKIITDIVKRYAEPWKKQNGNYQNFSSLLSSKCHGAEKVIVTQNNTALGSQVVYSGEPERTIKVTQDWFSTFPKDHPFSNKKYDSCSVVGNGGILINSKCGKQIDSAEFVIRCNIPPLEGKWKKDVGKKTNLVTANPSMLIQKFHALKKNYSRPFVESLRCFGDSMLLLPTFAFGYNTPVCLRAVYTIKDFDSPVKPVAFNPEYIKNLTIYWRSQGLKEPRLSTGFMMVSLALELCNNVDLYGFWPFSVHPLDCHPLTNHYYDNTPPRHVFHSMPTEFNHLLKLHSQGILRIHLGECEQ